MMDGALDYQRIREEAQRQANAMNREVYISKVGAKWQISGRWVNKTSRRIFPQKKRVEVVDWVTATYGVCDWWLLLACVASLGAAGFLWGCVMRWRW